MAVGILTVRGDKAALEFKTVNGTHMGVPFRRPEWAELSDRYVVLLSLKEQDDCISDINIITFLEVY